jgi:hypothetical protein
VTQNALIINPSKIILALPTSTPYVPLGVNDLVNKTYCDSLVGGPNVCTTNTAQTITAAKKFVGGFTTSYSNTGTNMTLNIKNDPVNGINTIESGLTSVVGSSADICFTSILNQNQFARMNSYGIYTPTGCRYGRNDGFAYNVASTIGVTNGLYPVGYCWEILGVLSTPVTGSNYVGVVASPALGLGVWAISGYLVINKGTGVYLPASSVKILWDTVVGVKIFPASSGLMFPLLAANTAVKYVIPLGTINVVVTTAGAIQTINRMISCTIGTLTWQVSFTGVKIA